HLHFEQKKTRREARFVFSPSPPGRGFEPRPSQTQWCSLLDRNATAGDVATREVTVTQLDLVVIRVGGALIQNDDVEEYLRLVSQLGGSLDLSEITTDAVVGDLHLGQQDSGARIVEVEATRWLAFLSAEDVQVEGIGAPVVRDRSLTH